MDEQVFISICIPAYSRVQFLLRLLDSISIQSFRNFEIVITDDSPGPEVGELAKSHHLNTKIRYFKNPVALGSPENWNEGLRKARGEWIKIMHDDDWFSGPESLQVFAETVRQGEDGFYYSAFTNVFPDGSSKTLRRSVTDRSALYKMPEILIANNFIGPPSVVIFKKDDAIGFDNRMQWLVDIDFYFRYLKVHPPAKYISASLIQIGLNETQITRSSFGNPEIEIPERFMLFEKMGNVGLSNIQIYDSWWRFIRNMNINEAKVIVDSGFYGIIRTEIEQIISFQSHIRQKVLKIGVFSKLIMLFHYLFVYRLNKWKHL